MFIIHGYQASTKSHWFQWLASQIEAYGYNVKIIHLPNSDHPDLDSCCQAKNVSNQNKFKSETTIVLHCLGIISILHYLTSVKPNSKIKALFLVSGFNEKLSNIPELNQYIDNTRIKLDKLCAQHIIT